MIRLISYNSSMSLLLDTSRPFRWYSELTELVRAISSAPPNEPEPDWLEWKSRAVLSEQRWHVLIAKFIAGFANRDPIVAKRSAGGCSYLVVGAEPGNVLGATQVDNAILHDGISRYVRESVRWNPQYIEHEGKQVLIVTVEPPEAGDLIVAMRRAYHSDERGSTSCREGDVFVRRHGKTELAGQEDYDMLVRRFANVAVRVSDISIRVAGQASVVPVSCDSDVISCWHHRQETSLLEPLQEETQETRGPVRLLNIEDRSPEEYRHEVATYLSKIEAVFPSIARAMALAEHGPSLQLLLVNDTEHNFQKVRVEIAIEANVWAYKNAEDAQPELPAAPRKWRSGPRISPPSLNSIPTLDIWEPQIDNSGPTIIEFADVDIRPSGREELDPIYLICDPKLAGKTLAAKWTATSSSASGVAHGEIPVKVLSQIFSPTIG